MHILGLDRFTKGKAMSGLARAGRDHNPFDLGVVKVSARTGPASDLRHPLTIRIAPTSGSSLMPSIIQRCTMFPWKGGRRTDAKWP